MWPQHSSRLKRKCAGASSPNVCSPSSYLHLQMCTAANHPVLQMCTGIPVPSFSCVPRCLPEAPNPRNISEPLGAPDVSQELSRCETPLGHVHTSSPYVLPGFTCRSASRCEVPSATVPVRCAHRCVPPLPPILPFLPNLLHAPHTPNSPFSPISSSLLLFSLFQGDRQCHRNDPPIMTSHVRGLPGRAALLHISH